MMRPLKSTPGLVLLAFLVVGFVTAEEPATHPDPFTAAELEWFIRDWPRFVEWAGSRPALAGVDEVAQPSGETGPSPEITEYLQVRGWEPERFFYIAGNATAGLLAVQIHEQTPDVELEQQRAIILQSPDLTQEQKADLIGSLDQLSTIDAPPGIPPSEMSLIRSMRQELQHALNPDY